MKLTEAQREELFALKETNDLVGPSFLMRHHWHESGYQTLVRRGLVVWETRPKALISACSQASRSPKQAAPLSRRGRMNRLAHHIGDDEPMTLAEACEIVFRGAIKPATLLAEAARGNLVMEKIGRRWFVSRSALNDMREKCRAQQKVPASGSIVRQDTGLSVTERSSAAQAAALSSARALRNSSDPTSNRNTSRRPTIVRLGS